jgi:hypothetical protein
MPTTRPEPAAADDHPDDATESAIQAQDTAAPTDTGVDQRTDAQREAAEFGGE